MLASTRDWKVSGNTGKGGAKTNTQFTIEYQDTGLLKVVNPNVDVNVAVTADFTDVETTSDQMSKRRFQRKFDVCMSAICPCILESRPLLLLYIYVLCNTVYSNPNGKYYTTNHSMLHCIKGNENPLQNSLSKHFDRIQWH